MKNPIHTIAFAAFMLLFIPEPLIAQYGPWGDPVAFSDSITDNRNPNIQYLEFIENDFYVFWEKSTDSLSTAIYYRKFYNGGEPDVFLSDESVHYTNLQLINLNFGYKGKGTKFYAFYESDTTGTNRVYYRSYDDGFSAPQELTTSAVEQTNLLCGNSGRVLWMEQNRIMHMKLDLSSQTFDDPVVIDSGNCSFPSISQPDTYSWWGGGFPVVAYIKEDSDSSGIKVRSYDEDDGWLDPVTIFTGDSCTNLSFCNGIGPLMILTWDYYNGTVWKIVTYDLEDGQAYMSGFDRTEPLQPVFYSGILPVKSSSYLDIGISSFVYKNNDTANIYTTPFGAFANPQLSAYQNVSGSDNLVTNPKVFSGKVIGFDYYFINIWEEKVNNHWQLKYSTCHEYLSKINVEDERDQVNLTVNPNPAYAETRISFSLPRSSDIVLSIHNSSGANIETLENGKLDTGGHSYIWKADNYEPGLYFVWLQSGFGITTKKMIILE